MASSPAKVSSIVQPLVGQDDKMGYFIKANCGDTCTFVHQQERCRSDLHPRSLTGTFSVNNILFRYKVRQDTTDTSCIHFLKNEWLSLCNILNLSNFLVSVVK